MTKEIFFDLLAKEVATYKSFLETDSGDWVVKGFINIYKKVCDNPRLQRLPLEFMKTHLISKLAGFAKNEGLEIELSSNQNYYPDLTFRDDEGHLFAVDIRSGYYQDDKTNSLALGSYRGYFRERNSVIGMDHSYNDYASHLVLGILYKHWADVEDNMYAINSVIENFIFFVQPKWKIASDKPICDNTRSIGSITNVCKLLAGQGIFAPFGEDGFDDYWMGYFNATDAQKLCWTIPPYSDFETYRQHLIKLSAYSERF